jgi:hypothetical protein
MEYCLERGGWKKEGEHRRRRRRRERQAGRLLPIRHLISSYPSHKGSHRLGSSNFGIRLRSDLSYTD